jgi:hypothetical protein
MGTSYYARVTATDGSEKAVSINISFTVMDLEVPTPQIISPANESGIPGESLVITWEEQPARGFRIELAGSSSFPPTTTQRKNVDAYDFSTEYTNLKSGVYYIRIAAQKSSGYSSYSNVVKVTMGVVSGIDKAMTQTLEACVANGNLIVQSERSERLTMAVHNLTGQLLSVSDYALQTGENTIPLNRNGLDRGGRRYWTNTTSERELHPSDVMEQCTAMWD